MCNELTVQVEHFTKKPSPERQRQLQRLAVTIETLNGIVAALARLGREDEIRCILSEAIKQSKYMNFENPNHDHSIKD